MKGKYFIIGVYSDINSSCPYDCFRPCEGVFGSIQACLDWISSHRKYFSSVVHFGICSIDNEFTI